MIASAAKSVEVGGFRNLDVAALAEHLQVLELLGVPVKVKVKDLNEAQEQALDSGQEFMKSMDKFRAMWSKANQT